jgi:hypothetical protein
LKTTSKAIVDFQNLTQTKNNFVAGIPENSITEDKRERNFPANRVTDVGCCTSSEFPQQSVDEEQVVLI